MRVISGRARGTKLNSIDDIATRPTLDRVKESLFNIIRNKIEDSVVLDLFAGSGAIGIELISRGASKAYFCEKLPASSKMIYKNLEKTKCLTQSIVIEKDYRKCLQMLNNQRLSFDIIYIDPPYRENIAVDAVQQILSLDLLKEEGIIIIETDDEQREIKELENTQLNVYDLRRYGRVSLIFLNRKG